MSRKVVQTRAGNARFLSAVSTLLPPRLVGVVLAHFSSYSPALTLVEEFLRCKRFDSALTSRLIEIAKGRKRYRWEVRRLAILMLERQLLLIPAEMTELFDPVLIELGLKSSAAGNSVSEAVLLEGYTTSQLGPFVAELRSRLSRLNRVHSRIRGLKTTAQALNDFIDLSAQECKLTLARYLLGTAEIVDRILEQVRTSSGTREAASSLPAHTIENARQVWARLPEFERQIVGRLNRRSAIYWVSDRTSSEINSLIEYPLSTVVLVLKPPGSDVEFEVKRAGLREDCPLGVVYRRRGSTVPPSHRLDGGSMGLCLRWEANASSLFSIIFRRVHDEEPSVPGTLSLSTIRTVPARAGEEHILDYLTGGTAFGGEFQAMRDSLSQSIEAFEYETDLPAPDVGGDLGATVRFLSQVVPGQAVLCGTSSFRLDRLAEYLSPNGAAAYFKAVGLRFTKTRARRFIDQVLEEILGRYDPPPIRYRNNRQYIKAAFGLRSNADAARANYLSAMSQIGRFWGTMLGVRGCSKGESLVGRNVGLKSVWRGGDWSLKMIFMDHDDLRLPAKDSEYFHPGTALRGMSMDADYIFGRSTRSNVIKGETDLLESIYRVDRSLGREGKSVLRLALSRAYRRTLDRLEADAELGRLMNPQFVVRLRDWDLIVRRYLDAGGDKNAAMRWRRWTVRVLSRRKYSRRMIREHIDAVEKYRGFLRKYRFLFQSVEQQAGCDIGDADFR